jgi:hypothetical protein
MCWDKVEILVGMISILGVKLNMVGAKFALVLIERQEIGCGVC